MPLELYYWKTHGRAAIIRILLKYFEVDYVEKNPASKEEYIQLATEVQNTKGLNFINLPFIVDGDFALSESTAIPYYICKKYGNPEFYGKDLIEEAHVKELEGVTLDLAMIIGLAAIKPDHKAALTESFKEGSKGDGLLKKLSKFLGDKKFLLGDEFKFPDLGLTTIIGFINSALKSAEVENVLDKYGNLVALGKRVQAIPKIKAYIESEEFKALPNAPPGMLTWLVDHGL